MSSAAPESNGASSRFAAKPRRRTGSVGARFVPLVTSSSFERLPDGDGGDCGRSEPGDPRRGAAQEERGRALGHAVRLPARRHRRDAEAHGRPRLRLPRGHSRIAAADVLPARDAALSPLAPRLSLLLRAGAARPRSPGDASLVGLDLSRLLTAPASPPSTPAPASTARRTRSTPRRSRLRRDAPEARRGQTALPDVPATSQAAPRSTGSSDLPTSSTSPANWKTCTAAFTCGRPAQWAPSPGPHTTRSSGRTTR